MNRISYTLVNEILKDNTTLIYGGGFKPPTKGHLAVVKQSLEKYPQVNKYIIFVGSDIRDGITQDQAVQIWNIYKKYLPVNMEVIPVSSPIKAVFDYSKENPDEDIIWVIGGRQGNEDDLKDFMNRTKTVKKYPNITATNIITPISNISGTKARQALKSGDKSEIITYFPSDISNQDIEQIIDITPPDLINGDEGFDRVDYYTSFITNVVPSNFNVFREENKIIVDNILNNTQENVAPNHKGKSSPYGSGYKKLNENTQKIGYRAGEFNPDYPAETLKDKGIGLTFSKIGLLGTGHYFLGSKQKAKELKNKGKYNVISQIDLSSYKLFKPDDPVGFYENIKELTAYIHSLTKEDLKEPETKEIIEDAVDGFSEYLNIPYNKTYKIINQYVSDIVNKKLDGPLLLNRLLFDYDGIDMTNTSLDDFSVGSLIFDKKLKPNTYKVINDKKSLKENINSPVNILKKITELISFMKEKGYNIEPLPKLKIVSDDKNNANKFLGKTAHYDPSNKCITLYTYGRHPKDIVRSFSHEMVHHIQNLEGRLGNISTTNTTEDDHLNKIEAEANLKGTMTFRNWTDNLNENLAKDSNYLYHWTSYSSCMKIIESNKLKSNKSNQFFEYDESRNLPDYKNVVFFTVENERFVDEENSNQCILVVDKSKLSKDYKVISYGDPYEETVVYTNDSSIPILPYLKGVILMNTLQKSAVKKMVEFLESKGIPYEINDKLEKEVKAKKSKLPNLKKELISKLKLKYPNGFIGYLNTPLLPYQTLEYFKDNSIYRFPNITINKPGKYGEKNKFQVKFKINPQNLEKYINWFMYSPDSIEDLINMDNYEGEELWLKGDIPIDINSLQEANLKGTMTFRNWTDSLNEKKNKDPFGINQYARELAQGLEENNKITPSTSEYKKIKEYTDKYKKYVLNELFEKDLPIIDKVSKNLYIVSNGNDIEAKYDIRLEIPERDLWSINWFFTPNNKNKSQEAWKQVTATSFRVLEDWLKTNNPKALYISGNTEAKTKLYKAYVDKLQTLLNNRYKIDNSDEDRVVLRSIEEVHQSGIKKRMETLNESYEQALSYWQNGDINSKSKIERWSSIKHKIERKVIKEMYKITEEQSQNYIIYCDMDGVIADFDKRFIDLSGMSPNQYEEKYGTEQFWDFIDNEIGVRFWVGIPWMKDGKQLWEYIEKYKPTLLSAPSRNNESRLGKRLWVKKHIPGTKLILASRKNKQNYAQPNAILIDDRSDTIIEWENQGGIGILHTSAEETINKLNKLML